MLKGMNKSEENGIEASMHIYVTVTLRSCRYI